MSAARTLLIADDSAKMRDVIKRCCTRAGDTVIEAGNGEEAVECFGRHRPDCAIIDIRMPVMDGLAAVREIRRRFPDARIAVVTQHDGPEWRDKSLASGADTFVLKDDLLQLLPFLEVLPPQTGARKRA